MGHLGYAVTSYRAQGITTDTAHVLVDSAMTRENLYVAMTRGRDANIAYVAVDQPDAAHDVPHPGDNQAATGRSVLYGVLQHAGAELSAHETTIAEQETWGSIVQLAAEYETIAAAAQHDRWATLIQHSGLTEAQVAEVLASDAFGPLTAELRRAEANHHDVDTLFPRLVRVRRLDDADDVAAVLHHRVATATTRPAGSGRNRKAPRLIAGLIPEATGTMTADMRQALDERRDLIEACADAVLDRALDGKDPWTAELGPPPTDARKLATCDGPPWSSLRTATATKSPQTRRSAPLSRASPKRSTLPAPARHSAGRAGLLCVRVRSRYLQDGTSRGRCNVTSSKRLSVGAARWPLKRTAVDLERYVTNGRGRWSGGPR